MLNSEIRTYPCVTPHAWRLLAAIRLSRGRGCDLESALEWSLEIARQAAHLELSGQNASTVVHHYVLDFGGTLRLEHAILAEAHPYRPLSEADLPEDVVRKIRYLARVTGRLPMDVIEWAAALAASTMSDRRAAEALRLAV